MALEKKNRAVTILKNATSSYARQLIQIAIFIVLTPFIVSKVGTENFGLWSLIQATIGILGLMDLGFATSVVKYVAEARGQGDTKKLGELTATFFWQYSALGLIALLLTVATAPFLPQLLGIAPEKARVAQIVFVLIGMRAAVDLPLGLFVDILVGYQKQLLSNLCRVTGTVSYGVLAWWALSVSPTIETLSAVSFCTGLFANLLAMIFCLRAAPGMSLSPRSFRRSLLGEISSFSLWFFLIQISLLLATRVDTIVINAVLPLTAVAVYTVAIRIVERAASLCRQLTNTLTPVIAELKGAGEEKNIRAVFLKGAMISVAAAMPMLVGLAWLAEDIAGVWMGEEFRASATPLRLLLAAALVGIVHSNTENILSMTGHQKFLALSSLGGQVLNLILTIILIHVWGLAGVALATLIAQLVIQLFFVQARGGMLYKVGYLEFYRAALWPSIPGALACVGAIYGLAQLLPPTSLLRIAVLLGFGAVCFAPALWILGLDTTQRTYFAGRFRALFQRKRKTSQPVEVAP